MTRVTIGANHPCRPRAGTTPPPLTGGRGMRGWGGWRVGGGWRGPIIGPGSTFPATPPPTPVLLRMGMGGGRGVRPDDGADGVVAKHHQGAPPERGRSRLPSLGQGARRAGARCTGGAGEVPRPPSPSPRSTPPSRRLAPLPRPARRAEGATIDRSGGAHPERAWRAVALGPRRAPNAPHPTPSPPHLARSPYSASPLAASSTGATTRRWSCAKAAASSGSRARSRSTALSL